MGTAQKTALNMLPTLMAVALGHVHDGMIINLRAYSAKLRARALAIVARIARVERDDAAALDAAHGAVKPAILIAARAVSALRAHESIRETGENLRAALARHQ